MKWTRREYDIWIQLGCPRNEKILKLDMCDSGLCELTPKIYNLPSLKYINISHNHIRFLPVEIELLESLVILLCHHNSLSCLPPSLVQLELYGDYSQHGLNTTSFKNLKILDISYNNFTFIPLEILGLDEFCCHGNRLVYPQKCKHGQYLKCDTPGS